MKRSLLVYKKGFSLLEILSSIVIFTVVFLGLFYFVSKYRMNYLSAKESFDNEIIIDGIYQCFSDDPVNFKDKITNFYDGNWDNNIFYFNDNDLTIGFMEDTAIIRVIVYNDGVEVENWIRGKKVL